MVKQGSFLFWPFSCRFVFDLRILITQPFVLFIPAISSAHSLAFCGVLCPVYHPFVLFFPAIFLLTLWYLQAFLVAYMQTIYVICKHFCFAIFKSYLFRLSVGWKERVDK
jgi:hypothetical protein